MACGLLSSCGPRGPEHMGSVVVACVLSSCGAGLSCPTACGILVPRPGIEPTSPALEGRFLTTGPRGNSLFVFIGGGSAHLVNKPCQGEDYRGKQNAFHNMVKKSY